MQFRLSADESASTGVFTKDQHAMGSFVARSGFVWQPQEGQETATVQAFAVANTKDGPHCIISAQSPVAYGGSICLTRLEGADGIVEYISIDKPAVPAQVQSVHVFTHALKGGMPYPLGALKGHLSTSSDRPALLDDQRTWSSFGDLDGGTMAIGLVLNRRIRISGWAQMVEDRRIVPIDYLQSLGVQLSL